MTMVLSWQLQLMANGSSSLKQCGEISAKLCPTRRLVAISVCMRRTGVIFLQPIRFRYCRARADCPLSMRCYCRCSLRQCFAESDVLQSILRSRLSVVKHSRTSSLAVAPVHSLESGAKLRSRGNAPKGPACSRAEEELAAVSRWREKFAVILSATSVPALRDVPSGLVHRWVLKLEGNARSRALKKHIQMCNVMLPGSKLLFRYLGLHRTGWLQEQPCARTVPVAFLAALAFFECAAGVPCDQRVSRRPVA